MADQLHISISTVKRSLHELMDVGFIQKKPVFVRKTVGRAAISIRLCFVRKAVAHENDNSSANESREPITVSETHNRIAKNDCVPIHISFDTVVREAALQEQTGKNNAGIRRYLIQHFFV